jgi:hypothetical protein
MPNKQTPLKSPLVQGGTLEFNLASHDNMKDSATHVTLQGKEAVKTLGIVSFQLARAARVFGDALKTVTSRPDSILSQLQELQRVENYAAFATLITPSPHLPKILCTPAFQNSDRVPTGSDC